MIARSLLIHRPTKHRNTEDDEKRTAIEMAKGENPVTLKSSHGLLEIQL
jgi:hypothetical protein